MEATFRTLFTGSGLSSKDEGIQAATLLHVIGSDALEVYNTFSWENEEDKRKVTKILKPTAFHGETSRGKDTCSILAANAIVKPPINMLQTSKLKPKHMSLESLKIA